MCLIAVDHEACSFKRICEQLYRGQTVERPQFTPINQSVKVKSFNWKCTENLIPLFSEVY